MARLHRSKGHEQRQNGYTDCNTQDLFSAYFRKKTSLQKSKFIYKLAYGIKPLNLFIQTILKKKRKRKKKEKAVLGASIVIEQMNEPGKAVDSMSSARVLPHLLAETAISVALVHSCWVLGPAKVKYH